VRGSALMGCGVRQKDKETLQSRFSCTVRNSEGVSPLKKMYEIFALKKPSTECLISLRLLTADLSTVARILLSAHTD
jgi:hypothetical protein